jgi:TPR repeat protein
MQAIVFVLAFSLMLWNASAHAENEELFEKYRQLIAEKELVERANQGDPEAQYRLKELVERANQGDPEAQYRLGEMYYYSGIRIGEGSLRDQDLKEAATWYRKAAEQGHADAQDRLGGMYSSGDGVLKDLKEAATWYRKAAEQGDAHAQYRLSLQYASGHGVPQDYVLAYLWANMSGANGAEMGVLIRAGLLKDMTPAQIEQAQELSRKCFAQNYKNCGL